MLSRPVFRRLMLLPIVLLVALPASAAAKKEKAKEADTKDKPAYVFETVVEVKRTSVKNQAMTGTCWSFATISFLESELLRLGKGDADLSEMYVVRHTYPLKAQGYVRLHGDATHSSGGQSHNVIDAIRTFGIVPEEAYSGQNIEEARHNHGEMSSVLQSMLDGVLKRSGRRLTPRWMEAYQAVLDVYLGAPPTSFTYQGKEYTPESFAANLGLNLDEYLELTSYSHHPFYSRCHLDVPDNWDHNTSYLNVPIDTLEAVVDEALKNGYSVAWDGDVSEKEFDTKDKGFAIAPEKDFDDKTRAEQEAKLAEPVKEKDVTQEMRQRAFDNFTTTDDHLMHIVGIAKDQKGTKFYLTKNSHGVDRKYDGYVYLSRAFFRLKTTAIMVNTGALPAELRTKLAL
jgi:bleomycin hydrolase